MLVSKKPLNDLNFSNLIKQNLTKKIWMCEISGCVFSQLAILEN